MRGDVDFGSRDSWTPGPVDMNGP